MHLSVSIVLAVAVTLIAVADSQRPDFAEPPTGNRPPFLEPPRFRLFPFRGGLPPPQPRFARPFNRPNRPFRFGRPEFLNADPSSELGLPFDLSNLAGPQGPPGPPRPRGGLFGPRDRSPPTVFSLFTTVPNTEGGPTSV